MWVLRVSFFGNVFCRFNIRCVCGPLSSSTQLRDPQLRDRSSLLAELDPELDTSDLAAQVAQMEKTEATAAAAAAAALLADPEMAAAAKP